MRNLLLTIVLWLACVTLSRAEADFRRVEDVIYGRKYGTALTMDIFYPAKTNGAAVIFMVSGGFYSSHDSINAAFYKPFLDRGYTVFAVVHGSQPRFVITEITQDIHRAVRFIRHNASQFGINPHRFGITGASAGGHLSLTMATQGKPGDPAAKDPIDRENSEVQAAACFFPPTDFLNYGKPGEDAVGVGILKDFKPAFGSGSDTAEDRQTLGRVISPIYYVSEKTAPVLIIHGDADTLVPVQQAQTFIEACEKKGVKSKLIVKPGGLHGWPGMDKDLVSLADWFDEWLK